MARRYSYRSTRRNWVKLWTAEWLRGTSRFELTPTQRSAWIDLLAMAGDSRVPGKICAGYDADEQVLGYPLSFISGILTITEGELSETLALLSKQGRIQVEKDARGHFIIILTSWDKYQSEYHRQKSYNSNSSKVTSKVTPETPPKLPVEGEVEVEAEVEGDVRGGAPLAPPTPSVVAAFASMKCEPFGSLKFRLIWTEEWSSEGHDGYSDAMERCIQRCKSLGVEVPGRFYTMKREVEKTEAVAAGHEMRRRTPL